MNIQKIKIIRGRTNLEMKELKKKIKKLGRTFWSKFIIKLTSKMFIPELYLQILKYERCNRTYEDISKTLMWFKTMDSLNDYINYKNENNSSKILLDIAWNSFYQYKKKMSIIKKANEDKNNFYLVLKGNLTKLTLIFKKEKISIEEYLIYMIKMRILKEKQILKKSNMLNSSLVNLDLNNFKEYFNNMSFNYRELKRRAKKELFKAGFILDSDSQISISSVENYIKLSNFETDERKDTHTKFYLYIGHYVKSNSLSKGDYIGDLSRNDNNEGCTYICKNNCDICYINKFESKSSKLFDYILLKMKKIFKEIKYKFYILKDTNDNLCLNYLVPMMVYKKYKFGDKIIVQNSQYEGIYFIINGKVKISISQTFNELSNTLVSLQYSIFNFKDYVSKIIKTIDILNEFNLKYIVNNNNKNIIDMNESEIHNKIFSSNEYHNCFKGIYNIDFYTLSDGDVLGLNELFDYKTELFNFNAECVSDEAILFFISKNYFNNVIQKDSYIMNNVIQLIDLKAKELTGKINLYRNDYKNTVINILKYKDKKNKISSKSCISLDLKKFNNIRNKKDYNKLNILKNRDIKLSESLKLNKVQNNISIFKKNDLLIYLKKSKFCESYNSCHHEYNKNDINEYDIIYGDFYKKINKLRHLNEDKDEDEDEDEENKPNNNKNKRALEKSKTLMDFQKFIDPNLSTTKNQKARNKSEKNKTIIFLRKKDLSTNLNSEQKDYKIIKRNNYSSLSNLPLISNNIKFKIRKISILNN